MGYDRAGSYHQINYDHLEKKPVMETFRLRSPYIALEV